MSAGNFFSGLLQGFGQSYHQHKLRLFEKEQEESANRFNYVSQILKDPTLDPKAKQQIMADFGTMMSKSAGKEGKQAFQHIQTIIGQGIPTGEMQTSEAIPSSGSGEKPKMTMKQEGSASPLPIAEAPASGPTGQVTQTTPETLPVAQGDLSSTVPTEAPIKPRMKMKSAYLSPEEMRAERGKDIYSDVQAQEKAVLPGRLALKKQEEDSRLTLEQFKAKARHEETQFKEEARANLDLRKNVAAKVAQFKAEMGREPSQDEQVQLEGEAGKEIQSLADAKLEDVKSRMEKAKASIKIAQTRAAGYLANLQSLMAHRKVTEGQGERRLAQGDQRLQLQNISNTMRILNEKLNKSYQEFDKWATVRGSTKYGDVAREAEQRMKGIEQEMNDTMQKLNEVGSTLEESPTSPKKSLKGGGGSGGGSTASSKQRPYKIISNDGGKTRYKFYGYKPDGSPDMEQIP